MLPLPFRASHRSNFVQTIFHFLFISGTSADPLGVMHNNMVRNYKYSVGLFQELNWTSSLT